MKKIFIDIRQSDEVYQKRFGESSQYQVYNIPMNMIRFNQKTIINHLEYIDDIYIVCHSGQRSQFIKDKYFPNQSNIKVNYNLQFKNLKHGNNIVTLDDISKPIQVKVIGSNSFNLYNMTRIIQILLGTLILTLGGYTYYQSGNIRINRIPLIILLFFGLMALFNGVTATCTLSKLLVDYLN
jgi:hypothetical protein